MANINVDDIIRNFATDLLNTVLVQLSLPYTSQSGRRFKGLDKSSTLYNSVQVVYDSTPTITIESLDYLKYLESGRRAGARKIPVQVILKWIKRKKIRPRDSRGRFKSMTLNQLAWVIQRSIHRIGIRPRKIIEESIKQIEKLYTENVETGLEEIVNQLFDSFNQEINKNFNDIIKITPRTIKPK